MPDIQRIPFHEDELYAIIDERTGKEYVLPKRFCEIFRLSWAGQHSKLTRSPLFSKCINKILMQLPGDTIPREVLLLERRMVDAWLMRISVERVADDLKEKLLRYQEECAHVLDTYFSTGAVLNPRLTADVTGPWDMLAQMVEAGRRHAEQIRTIEAQQHAQMQATIEAQRQALEALTSSARAETKADHALHSQDWQTLRQYVCVHRLDHQLPPSDQSAYGTWLSGYCLQNNIPVYEIRPADRPYAKENQYHAGTIEDTLPGWLKRRYAQATLHVISPQGAL